MLWRIIKDNITLFLFIILKLLCPNFCTLILFSYINVYIELCGESHLRATIFKFTFDKLKLDLTLLYLRSFLCFKTLVLHVSSKVLVKSHGRFGVLKYNTYCRLEGLLWPRQILLTVMIRKRTVLLR